MTIGSLFSGIGGLELGLERAGLGPVVFQVESDPYCRHVLARHWPAVPRFDDVRHVGSDQLVPVDILCGGFPCQDVSAAGEGAGLDGARSGLWYQMHRIVEELRPPWVVIENVASGARRWLPYVRRGLWDLGYAALPIRVRAADVGANHRRARIFVVASNVAGDGGRTWSRLVNAGTVADPDDMRELQPSWGIANLRRWSDNCASTASTVADAHRSRLEKWSRERGDARKADSAAAQRDVEPWPGAGVHEPAMVRTLHGLSGRVDRRSSAVRKDRIHGLGNAVVPVCAEVVGRLIAAATSKPESPATPSSRPSSSMRTT